MPQNALDKYPGWKPKYCKAHSPKKNASNSKENKTALRGTHGNTKERMYTLEEVLAQFSAGPQNGIFTDGSARPNPGPGGWGYVHVIDGKVFKQDYGHEAQTTNNRMELTALINAYRNLSSNDTVDLYSDSNLCVNTINIWAKSWEKRGWRRKDGEIANLDLVQEAFELARQRPKASLKWIEAHNGWLWNEYADSLSTAWMRETL